MIAWRLFSEAYRPQDMSISPATLYHRHKGDKSLPLDVWLTAYQGVVYNPGKKLTGKSFRAAYGSAPSSHERGTTVDIARQSLSHSQRRWLITRLLYYRATGRILVIEEIACYHVFVIPGGMYVQKETDGR
jgi:hypothetical protein